MQASSRDIHKQLSDGDGGRCLDFGQAVALTALAAADKLVAVSVCISLRGEEVGRCRYLVGCDHKAGVLTGFLTYVGSCRCESQRLAHSLAGREPHGAMITIRMQMGQ